MSAVRSRDTLPELTVRQGLHALGFRYRLHSNRLLGRPDLVLPKFRAVIWIHGCFWHGHTCPAGKLPETRREFWEMKINRNRERDSNAIAAAQRERWRTLVVWECSIKANGADPVVAAIAKWLRSDKTSGEI